MSFVRIGEGIVTKINYAFIAELEGGSVNKAYVPDPEKSKSGVTVGKGFDLGCRNLREINRAFNSELYQKLFPYIGLKGRAALGKLDRIPLTLTDEECAIINRYAQEEATDRLRTDYLMVTGVQYEDLPEQAQTVIASVGYQYGTLSIRCPNFWGMAIRQDWVAMLEELRNFGDRYPTRRNREADYLETLMS